MPGKKITFTNQDGIELAGLLEIPDTTPDFFALFAHCFTCSKDLKAAARISQGLVQKGIAVLRFDFTGIGNSEGDFANTNFSSNLEDIISAADYLGREYTAPKLLIGHSLGGAAVLAVADAIKSSEAIVTIGAPATARHLDHIFTDVKDDIRQHDEARIRLGGRDFTVRKQFLQDLESHNTTSHISEMGKALLVFHSPVDEIVSIDEAARIYKAARHPKSFISLDKADHLLSNKRDSEYVSDVIGSWSSRYIGSEKDADTIIPAVMDVEHGQVMIKELNHKFRRQVYTESHQLVADEPVSAGGEDKGPNPYDYLLAALGSCTSMTVRMYANRKNIQLDNIDVTLAHKRIHASDCENCDTKEGMVDLIDKQIRLEGNLTDQERDRLLEIADKCPIHKTLLNEIAIQTTLL